MLNSIILSNQYCCKLERLKTGLPGRWRESTVWWGKRQRNHASAWVSEAGDVCSEGNTPLNSCATDQHEEPAEAREGEKNFYDTFRHEALSCEWANL